MADNVWIEDLDGKISLILRSDRTRIQSLEQLRQHLKIGKDMLSRIKAGTRKLTEDNFLKLCEAFDTKQKFWFLPIHEFGRQLGFTRQQIALIANSHLPGIDFNSRIRGERAEAIASVIKGYWESYYYSVSRIDKPIISKDLLIIRDVNEDGYIECEIDDSHFRYSGWCFPIQSHLYFILEKTDLYNEIIVYVTNIPDRDPPMLYGVMLCLSGGVDDMQSYPSAARVAFRFLGRKDDIKLNIDMSKINDIEQYLRQTVPQYVEPNDPNLDQTQNKIIKDINNIITPETIPAALRMAWSTKN